MAESDDTDSDHGDLLGDRNGGESWQEELGIPTVRISREWPHYPDDVDFTEIDWVAFYLRSIVDDLGNASLKIDDSQFFSCAEYILKGESLRIPGDSFGNAVIAIANYDHIRGELLRLISYVKAAKIPSGLWIGPDMLTRMVEERFDGPFDAMSMLELGKPDEEIVATLERMRKAASSGLDAFLFPFLVSLEMHVEETRLQPMAIPAGLTNDDIDRLRAAIATTTSHDGKHAGMNVVVREAGGTKQLMLEGLAYLEHNGEYTGRQRPPRRGR